MIIEFPLIKAKLVKRYENTDLLRFDLPFKTGDRIKINIPIMNTPLYGFITRELNGNSWYNFLYKDINNTSNICYLDISHINIDRDYPKVNYSIFDWLDKA